MRLWHKDLIPYLPRQQLLSQWRECCCIARNIAVNGTPNHILVNKIMYYPQWHFMYYAIRVSKEMERRGYKSDRRKFFKWFDQWDDGTVKTGDVSVDEMFHDWHNYRYLRQCLYNLQEKCDCGGIDIREWTPIYNKFGSVMRKLRLQ